MLNLRSVDFFEPLSAISREAFVGGRVTSDYPLNWNPYKGRQMSYSGSCASWWAHEGFRAAVAGSPYCISRLPGGLQRRTDVCT